MIFFSSCRRKSFGKVFFCFTSCNFGFFPAWYSCMRETNLGSNKHAHSSERNHAKKCAKMKKVDGRNWVKIKTKKEKKRHNLTFPVTIKNSLYYWVAKGMLMSRQTAFCHFVKKVSTCFYETWKLPGLFFWENERASFAFSKFWKNIC